MQIRKSIILVSCIICTSKIFKAYALFYGVVQFFYRNILRCHCRYNILSAVVEKDVRWLFANRFSFDDKSSCLCHSLNLWYIWYEFHFIHFLWLIFLHLFSSSNFKSKYLRCSNFCSNVSVSSLRCDHSGWVN